MSSPLFSNFSRLRRVMRKEIYENGLAEYKNIYVCNSPLLGFMNNHFPKYMEHRHIGNINTDHFKHWDDKEANLINIKSSVSKNEWNELNKLIKDNDKTYDFVSIGGPSAFLSNHEYIMNNNGGNKIRSSHFFLSRHDSNYDGSAYYYHERDAFPVYINKVNRGQFCVFIDLFKRFYCLLSKEKFINYCQTNEGFVKININWLNIFKKPSIIYTILYKNFYLMIKNLYSNGKDLNNCLLHAQQTPNVVKKFVNYYKDKNLKFDDLLILNKENIKAVYVNIDENYDCNKHFKWMNKKFGNIPFINFNKNEMIKYGFNLKYIKEIIGFPNDGCINPHFLSNLINVFQGEYKENWMIKNIWYNDDGVICKLESKLGDNKESKYIKTRKLSLSLGPSANYKLDNKSFLNDYMFASGSTSVVLFAIKCNGKYKENADKFINKCSLFIDSVNQHWTPIEIKKDIKLDLDSNDKEDELYHLAVLQMTGGGNFPSRHTSPDVVLNLLTNCEKIFGLNSFEENSIYYDIIQLRGCGRGVTGNNTINFASLNKNNICITYGLGGIGMTTMFANAMLINQILENNNNNHIEFKSKGILNHIDYKSMVQIL
mmetsp:Transcript_35264/g.31112  ORF Transcript_35264/g.31112 Transcript_35264/m.31112 type:complete len:599 (+) Transcript_35264:107-1903(+)